MERKIVFGLILVATLAINLILMFTLAWNPFGYFLNQPELSNISYSTRTNAVQIANAVALILIWGSFVYSLIKTYKTKRNNILSLVISLLFIIGLSVSNWVDKPEDYYSYRIEKDNYEYMEKHWYGKGDTLFEKWKSVKPYNSELPRGQTEWKLIETNKK
jgi:hypothetical protein